MRKYLSTVSIMAVLSSSLLAPVSASTVTPYSSEQSDDQETVTTNQEEKPEEVVAQIERPVMNMLYAKTPPKIDGSLVESYWADVMNQQLVTQIGDGKVGNAKFGVVWDLKNMYVAVEIEDDELIHNGEGAWFEQDNVSIFIDPTSHQSEPFQKDDVQLGFVFNPDSSAPIFHFGAAANHAGKDDSMIQRAIQKTDSGWSIEVAIPWSFLNVNPAEAEKVGFEVTVGHKGEDGQAPITAWSAYNSSSFWNDTSGYGVLRFDQNIVQDSEQEGHVFIKELQVEMESEVEALIGPLEFQLAAIDSEGTSTVVENAEVNVSSSDETIVKVENNRLYPIKEGTATVTFRYDRVSVTKEITVKANEQQAVIVKELATDAPYHLQNVGEFDPKALMFSATYNDFTESELSGDELDWTIEGQDAVISSPDGEIMITEKGVYHFTAKKDQAEIAFTVIAKEASESEYVLFDESFDDIDTETLKKKWSLFGPGKDAIEVKDGSLFINGKADSYTATGVLLPSYLEHFGNYDIEASITHVEANDAGRWNAIMYRVQNNTYPYYQMAVRKDATTPNGVEFTERTPGNGWNVMEKTSFTEAIAPGNMYTYSIKAYGNRVQQLVNGKLLIDNDRISDYKKGNIGIQAAGSLTKVDSIRVTLLDTDLPELPAKPGENFVKVTEPTTSISSAPTVVRDITDKASLNKLLAQPTAATAFVQVTSDLTVVGKSGKPLMTVTELLDQLDEKVMPAFSMTDIAAVAPLIDLLKERRIEDAFIVSSDKNIIKQARDSYPILRGILDLSGNTYQNENDWMNIRQEVNANRGNIVILNEESASYDAVRFLQKKLMTVWTKESGKTDLVGMHKLLTSGTNGMLVENSELAYQAMESYSGQTTLLKTPFIIGHRGMPGKAPENTVEGSLLAYEMGADMIENDIFLTKDGQIVVMHDNTINRTTNGTGNVEDFTLAELKTFKANKQFPTEYPDVEIPTLAEYFEAFKGKDADIFVEVKSGKPEIIDKLVALIAEYDIEDQVSVISFSGEQLQRLNKLMPGMSIGYLTGGTMDESNLYPSLREVLNTVQNLDATFNTSYAGLTKAYAEAAKHRGITFWPWTYRNQAVYQEHFLLGTHGLTTDDAHWSQDWAYKISPELNNYKVRINEFAQIDATLTQYNRSERKEAFEIVPIAEQNGLEIEGNKVKASKPGTYHVLLRYEQEIGEGNSYAIYSQPIEIIVEKKTSGSGSGGSGGSGKPDPIIPIDPIVVFSDIKGHWAEDYIQQAAQLRIIEGYPDGTFKPNTQLTRAQAIAIISRALNLQTDEPAPFNDIEGYAAETQAEIAAAYKFGIVQGYSDGSFRPANQVTRAQIALLLHRAYEYKMQEKYVMTEKAPYLDFGSYDDETVRAISMLYELGIATGANGNYMPNNPTTRAHAAKMLVNFFKEIEE